jgi:Acetyl-coenzyme A transporter 1
MSMNFCFAALECVSEPGKKACEEIGGDCVTQRDGYYYVSSICVAIGVVSLVVYVIPTARRLQCTWSMLIAIFTEITLCL